jgi:hypothetical protein
VVNLDRFYCNRRLKCFKTEIGLRLEDNYGQGWMDDLALLCIKKDGASHVDYSNLFPVCCKKIKEAGFCEGGTIVMLSHTEKYI